jgi:hypothetical protein
MSAERHSRYPGYLQTESYGDSDALCGVNKGTVCLSEAYLSPPTRTKQSGRVMRALLGGNLNLADGRPILAKDASNALSGPCMDDWVV